MANGNPLKTTGGQGTTPGRRRDERGSTAKHENGAGKWPQSAEFWRPRRERAMSLFRNFATGLRSLFRKNQVYRDLDEELGAYLEMEAAEKMRQGVSRKDALREVRLERGSLEVTKELVRSGGWEFFVETCWQDLRFAARMLRKNPGFTSIAVLTLALGIGATTAVFSAIDTVLLQPLPYAHPEQLMLISESLPKLGGDDVGVAAGEYLDYRDRNRSFAQAAAYQNDGF